jgi:hypothetical protein
MGHQFPLYRKHASGKSYFIILSDTEYTEFQFVGKQIFRYEFKIKTYFDTLHMKSLLDAAHPFLIAEKQEMETLITML